MLHHLLALQGFIKLPRLPLKALTIIQLPPHHTHPVNCLYPAQVLITWWHSFWFPSLCPRQMLGQTQGKAQRCLGWLQLRTLAWAGWCHLTICNCGVDTLPGAHYCWVGKLTCFTMWIKAHSNPGFFRGWLLQAFSQGLGPKTTGGSLLRVAGIHSALYLGKAAYFRKKIPGDQVFCLFSCWCPQGFIFDQIHTDEEPRAPEGGDIFTAMVLASALASATPFTLEIVGWRKLGIFRIPVPSREWIPRLKNGTMLIL